MEIIIIKITPETHKSLSPTGYTGKTMKKDSDILMMNNIINDIGYTGDVNKKAKRENFLLIGLPKKVAEIENKELSDDLEANGLKNFFIPNNIIDIYARLEVLFRSWQYSHRS